MYDPSVGRFLEEDPIGFDAGDADLYRYGGNSPLDRVDPSGTEWENPQREYLKMQRWAAFRRAATKNKIPQELVDKIHGIYSDTWIFPFRINTCLAWTEEFQKNLEKGFGKPGFPFKGTGLKGRMVSWKVDWIFSFATDTHVAYEIEFPDGQVFYFDNGFLTGGLAIDKDIPTYFKDKR